MRCITGDVKWAADNSSQGLRKEPRNWIYTFENSQHIDKKALGELGQDGRVGRL